MELVVRRDSTEIELWQIRICIIPRELADRYLSTRTLTESVRLSHSQVGKQKFNPGMQLVELIPTASQIG